MCVRKITYGSLRLGVTAEVITAKFIELFIFSSEGAHVFAVKRGSEGREWRRGE